MLDLDRTSRHLEVFKRRIFSVVYFFAILTLIPSFNFRNNTLASGIDHIATPFVLGAELLLLLLLLISNRGLKLAGHMLFIIPSVFLTLKLYTLLSSSQTTDISVGIFLIIPWAIFTHLYSYLVYGSRFGLFMSALFFCIQMAVTLYAGGFWGSDANLSGNQTTALFSLHLTSFIATMLFYLYSKVLERHSEAFYSARTVARLATVDSLTQLPNRMAFQEYLSQALAQDKALAVLFIDLDGFKSVNDSLSHEVGDKLLQQVAERLKATVYATDYVARLGGDEFTIVLLDASTAEKARHVSQKLIAALNEAFVIDNQSLYIGASIGISLAPEQAREASSLLTKADSAMYRAKRGGKNRCEVYSDDIAKQTLWHSELEQQLYKALKDEAFCLHYQPIYDLKTRRICGFEALLRWQNPDGKFVPPQDFIPLLEKNGMIIPVGKWITQEACKQVKAWQTTGHSDIYIAINVSAIQMLQPDFALMIQDNLAKNNLAPEAIELEVTESVVINPCAIEQLAFLRNIGMKVAVDDFGTGYSSLAYLQRLPIDIIKIDKRFVDELLNSDSIETANLTKIIVSLADTLSKGTVAEGVETKEQLSLLRQLGCHKVQGYLISKPLTANQACRVLDKLYQKTDISNQLREEVL